MHGGQVFSGDDASNFMFSNFCFEGNVSPDSKFMYISDIDLPDQCYKKDLELPMPSSLFHDYNCPIITDLIRILQDIQRKLQETLFGQIFRPKFILVGSVAESTKVGTFANELDVTVQFEVNLAT